jgi:sortase A
VAEAQVAGSSLALRWIERTLVAVGVVCLGYYGYMSAEARQFQREQAAAFESLLPPAAGEVTEPRAGDSAPERTDRRADGSAATSPPGAGVLALLDIPRLNISTPVLSGDDDATLEIAVGHLPDTPKPWESGNSAFAAHRDGLFRPLRNIRVGDEVRVRTLEGEFTYRVRETKIVVPTNLSVLEPRERPTLTLITCYPFNFVGHAPKRFVVHADRLPADPQ